MKPRSDILLASTCSKMILLLLFHLLSTTQHEADVQILSHNREEDIIWRDNEHFCYHLCNGVSSGHRLLMVTPTLFLT